MKNSTTVHDSVTIAEALKRLGNQAPARQSFYDAVNTGKLRKEPTSKDGKIRISMASVHDYIKQGGFRKRGKAGRKAAADAKVHPEAEAGATAKAKPADPSPPTQPVETGTPAEKERKFPKHQSPPVTPGPARPDSNHGQDSQSRSQAKPKESTWKQRKPVPVRDQARHMTEVKSNEALDTKVPRRSPPLRVLKNSLRHLTYEQTKAIRDWADNRLLTVLRPIAQVIIDPKDVTQQPA